MSSSGTERVDQRAGSGRKYELTSCPWLGWGLVQCQIPGAISLIAPPTPSPRDKPSAPVSARPDPPRV